MKRLARALHYGSVDVDLELGADDGEPVAVRFRLELDEASALQLTRALLMVVAAFGGGSAMNATRDGNEIDRAWRSIGAAAKENHVIPVK